MKTIIAFLCVALLAPALALAGDKFPEISHDELMQAIEANKVTVIDVNGSASYAQGHIPGAIDYTAAEDQLASKLPKEKDALVVAYCGSEKCGAYARAAEAAVKLGYTNVKHYKPGIAGWKEQNAPLERAGS